ncbi:MAG: hypothetical protein GY711_27755 [bacterium]|nr:hypothetical protein [bacterium]
MRDRTSGTSEHISISNAGQSYGASRLPTVSGDGQRVAFTSFSSELVPGDTNGEFGFFLVGSHQGTFVPPGSQGVLCLTCSGFQGCAGIGRFNRAGEIIQGPSGSLMIDLSALHLTPQAPVQPGETWNFQCWFRDSSTSNFTDAIAITFV